MQFIRDLISNIGGRRFVLVIGNALICTYLLMNGYISEGIYRDLIISTTAVYIAANTTQKFKKDQPSGD